MRILFLTHYFPPESNAPAIRTHEHCREWVRRGHEVHVVTCMPSHPRGVLYPGYRGRVRRTECVDGIHVHRVRTYLAPNQGVVKRTLNYVSYVLPAFWRSLRIRRPDVVISTSPQFFCSVAGWLTTKARRRPWVFELRDLWPESVAAVGAVQTKLLLRPFEMLARFFYRQAAAVVCVTRAFMRILEAQGIPVGKLHFVPNGVDPDLWGGAEDSAQWREALRVPEGAMLVGYVGTLGMAHGLGTVLEAAALLEERADPPVFVLAGDGAARDELRALAASRGLAHVRFTGQVDHASVPGLLGALDVALVPLRNTPVFRTVLPSKMFEAMAAARPVVLGVDGEARAVLERAEGGIAVEPEDPEALAAAIERLAQEPERRVALGQNGQAFVQREFDRAVLARAMESVLEAVCQDRSGRPSSR